MNNLKRLISIAFAVLIIAFSAGCGAEIPVNTDSPEAESGVSSQSSESIRSSGTDTNIADQTYKMADIKQLKNTWRFAENTLEHIFDGTINKKGKATGYHYTMVTDSKGKVVEGTRSDVDENGVFTGKVEVEGVRKNGFSSFFPESWSPQQVVDAINIAYDDATENPNNPKGSLWIGYCGDLEIDMYLNADKRITSAFPVYEGD